MSWLTAANDHVRDKFPRRATRRRVSKTMWRSAPPFGLDQTADDRQEERKHGDPQQISDQSLVRHIRPLGLLPKRKNAGTGDWLRCRFQRETGVLLFATADPRLFA